MIVILLKLEERWKVATLPSSPIEKNEGYGFFYLGFVLMKSDLSLIFMCFVDGYLWKLKRKDL